MNLYTNTLQPYQATLVSYHMAARDGGVLSPGSRSHESWYLLGTAWLRQPHGTRSAGNRRYAKMIRGQDQDDGYEPARPAEACHALAESLRESLYVRTEATGRRAELNAPSCVIGVVP